MKKVIIIGAGQIGSRHLQALAAIKTPLDIYVVDPTEKPTADNMDPTLIPTFDLEGTFGEDACISITPLGVDVDIRVEGIIPTCVPELTATPEPIID